MAEPVLSEAEQRSQLAGFWARILAFVLDSLFLSAIGMVLAFFFGPYFVTLHSWGRCIGIAIALAYLGVLNSSLGGGQTLGKRLTKIAVVGRNGRPIGLGRSIARSAVLTAPFFVNGWVLPDLPPFASIFIAVVLFGGIGAIIYLYVANRRTRQSLHDLLVGSFVCRADAVACPLTLKVRPVHVAVAANWYGLVLLFLLLSPLGGKLDPSDIAKLGAVRANVATVPGVWHVAALKGTTHLKSVDAPERTALWLTVIAYRDPSPEPPAATAVRVAAKVIEVAPDLLGQRTLTVRVIQGFDIGFASFSTGYFDTKTAEEWRTAAKP